MHVLLHNVDKEMIIIVAVVVVKVMNFYYLKRLLYDNKQFAWCENLFRKIAFSVFYAAKNSLWFVTDAKTNRINIVRNSCYLLLYKTTFQLILWLFYIFFPMIFCFCCSHATHSSHVPVSISFLAHCGKYSENHSCVHTHLIRNMRISMYYYDFFYCVDCKQVSILGPVQAI